MTRYITAVAIALGIVVPSFAMAQSAGNGLLSVYVQVTNPGFTTIYPYGQVGGRTSADFSVSVSGNNPSPTTFWGSQTGTQVSLNPGTYSVALGSNPWGYTATYSAGCNSTIAAGGTALCIITVSPNYQSYPYPSPYPFPYTRPSLTCQPYTQTAGLFQNVRFEAVGGVGGTYNWQIPGRNYPNVGPVLTVAFDSTGSQLVTVTNANQTATCNVNIQQGYVAPAVTNPIYPTYIGTPAYSYPGAPTLSPTYYPRLPNTGVEPLTLAQLMVALALLGAAAALSAPFVRKAFAIVTH